jgi:hypothetical protein
VLALRLTYAYDVRDRRLRVDLDDDGAGPNLAATLWTAYGGVNPYADFGGGGGPIRRFVSGRAPDSLLAADSSGAMAWTLTDRQGSVRVAASPVPTIGALASYTYTGFGYLAAGATLADRFRYTGRELDQTDLQYHRARYYDAAAGWPWGRLTASLFGCHGLRPCLCLARPAFSPAHRRAGPVRRRWSQTVGGDGRRTSARAREPGSWTRRTLRGLMSALPVGLASDTLAAAKPRSPWHPKREAVSLPQGRLVRHCGKA